MIIQSKRVYLPGGFMPAQIEIENERIKGIFAYNEKKADVDYENKRILPGFYDIHTHGYHGYDTSNGDKEGLKAWCKYLPSEGVCGFLPTTLTQSHDVLIKAIQQVRDVKKENPEGAEIMGIHFEGPYLNVNKKGAQPEEYIVKGTIKEFKEYQEACDNMIKVITLAPEMDDNFELTKYCAETGVRVSIGHTEADYDTAILALANGASGFTHTFNGMTAFNHRKNGVIGASLRTHDNYSEVICDGNHSTLMALNMFFREKQNHGIMVTDSLMCKGFPVGSKFNFGGQEIEIYSDGSAHLTIGTKSLAGGGLRINQGLKILVEEASVPFEDALMAVSINPIRYLGMDDHKGLIRTNYDADIVVLNDDYSVEQTYCNGKEML